MDHFERVFPEPFQVLGLKLKPLSLGRYRLLHRFGCGFVADGQVQASFEDLLIGVLICSMRVEEFLAWCESKRFAKDIRRWRKKIFPHAWLGFIPGLGKKWRAKKAPNIAQKITLFQRYIRTAIELPMFLEKPNDQPISSGSHWSHSVEIGLRSELGWTQDEINEQPISKAIADFLKLLDSRNQIRLIDETDLAGADENTKILQAAMMQEKKVSVLHGA